MISIFPDGYRPESPAPGDHRETSLARNEALDAGSPCEGTAGRSLCGAGLRAGVLRRLGMDEARAAAELGLPQAEVRFLFKLDRIRMGANPDANSKTAVNFPQAEQGICDSSTVHLAVRGYRS